MISAAHTLSNAKQSVDELNIFPVPDGDTGTNMSMTIGTAVTELRKSSPARWFRHSFKKPSAVSRTRLQRSQNSWLMGLMKPILPRKPAGRTYLAGP